MKLILFILLCAFGPNLQAQEEELIELNYKTLKKEPQLFERQKIKLSGIVTNIENIKLKDNLEVIKFKLSKTSEVNEYFQVYFYKKYLGYNLPPLDIITNKILEVEGEFRKGYELSATKRLGDIYVNVDPYNKMRKTQLAAIRSNGYIAGIKNKVVEATIPNMAIDFFESDQAPIIKIEGYVIDVQYVDEQNGNIYYNIYLRDYLSPEEKKSARYLITARYYLRIRGQEVADINMEDFFQKDQRTFFTGQYQFIEKSETTKMVGIVNINYFDEKQEYKDHFVHKFNLRKKKAVAQVSNANNTKTVQSIKEF